MNDEDTQRVLVFRIGSLGDTLISLPALRVIRARHPHSRIALLTDTHPGSGFTSSWEVLDSIGLFSAVYFYSALSTPRQAFGSLLDLALQLRRFKPQRLYYLAPTPRTRRQVWRDALFFRWGCGIADRQGMRATDEWVGKRDINGNPLRLEPEYLRLLRTVCDDATLPVFGLPIGERDKEAVDVLWRERRLSLRGRLIAVAPGAKHAAQRWPAERYVSLARALASTYPDASLLIVGSQEDVGLARAINDSVRERGINTAGRLSVLESAEAIRRCSFLVGNNSGPMHLAAVMGVPCVAICSARDNPGMWEPYGDRHVVLRKHIACAGCRLEVCRKELACLAGISVEEVLQACVSIEPGERGGTTVLAH